MNPSTQPNQPLKILAILLIAAGILLMLPGLAPLSALHLLFDPLSADNRMEALDLPQVAIARAGVAGIGFLLLLAGAAVLAQPARAAAAIQWGRKHIRELGQDNRRLLADLVDALPKGWEIALLGLVIAAGMFTRLALLPAPMQYDEAVTFNDFASRTLWAALSDYSLPNNHVFHTLLVHISYRLFGDAPWIVRLPAFLAGILCIPAAYLLGKSHYNRTVGWLAAALAAWWPQMVFYSANARGYSLLGLFSLLIFTLAGIALKRRSPAAWAWIALLSAFGLFTVPVMAYSIGVLYTWLLFSLLVKEPLPAYKPGRFFAWMVTSGAAALGLAGIFYLPVLFASGPDALLGNKFVQSFTWSEFVDRLPFFLNDIWTRFTQAMPLAAILLIGLGLVLSLALHSQITRHKIPVLASALVFFAVAMPLQRPEMLSKLFFFSLPLLAVWAAAGWVAVVQRFFKQNLESPLLAALTLIVAAACVVQAQPNLPYLTDGATGAHEQIAGWLKDRMQPDDVALVDFPLDAQVLYYARRAGLPLEAFREVEEREYHRAFVLVNPYEDQSLESVAAHHPLSRPLDISTAHEEIEINNTHIYSVDPIR